MNPFLLTEMSDQRVLLKLLVDDDGLTVVDDTPQDDLLLAIEFLIDRVLRRHNRNVGQPITKNQLSDSYTLL